MAAKEATGDLFPLGLYRSSALAVKNVTSSNTVIIIFVVAIIVFVVVIITNVFVIIIYP